MNPEPRTQNSKPRQAVLIDFIHLMRFHKPIGTLLLLWPALWGLWLAAGGVPQIRLMIIFTLGAVVMRAAGCVINDFADRHIDRHVTRTRDRPLTTGRISSTEALVLFALLCAMALVLVLLTNRLTLYLAIGGLAIISLYPFIKRHSHLPQVVLGAAWGWTIPMAFAAQAGTVPAPTWTLFVGVLFWAMIFDTFYAMVDREDDLKIGVKSTAILFGEYDLRMIALFQGLMLLALLLTGKNFALGAWYYGGLMCVAGLFLWQLFSARHRDREGCFRAFLNNQWVGLVLFLAIVLDYGLS